MDLDLTKFSDGELVKIKNAIRKEIERRVRIQKEAEWRKVCEVLENYIKLCGDIAIDDSCLGTIYLNETIGLSNIGIIKVR